MCTCAAAADASLSALPDIEADTFLFQFGAVKFFAHVIVRINPSTRQQFLPDFGFLRLPRLTLNAAMRSETKASRLMSGGGGGEGVEGWCQRAQGGPQ